MWFYKYEENKFILSYSKEKLKNSTLSLAVISDMFFWLWTGFGVPVVDPEKIKPEFSRLWPALDLLRFIRRPVPDVTLWDDALGIGFEDLVAPGT